MNTIFVGRRRFITNGVGAAAACVIASGAPAWGDETSRLTATEVADGVFVSEGVHELNSATNGGHIANASFVIGSDSVAVVDSGGSAGVGRALLQAIRALTDRPIRYLINTHMHPDHILGNSALLDASTIVVGHAKLPRGLVARGDRYMAASKQDLSPSAFAGSRIVPPTLLVDTGLVLDLGGRTLTLTARKTAHTDNDLTVRDEKTGTVFLGDLLFCAHIPTLDGSIRGWLQVLEQLKLEPAARVVPGHGPASMPWPEAMAAEAIYLKTVVRDVRALIKQGGTMTTAMASVGTFEKTHWLLADEFHARTVAAAFAELEWE
jgi:quinoprotein relay system zinc metallohydrolase 2